MNLLKQAIINKLAQNPFSVQGGSPRINPINMTSPVKQQVATTVGDIEYNPAPTRQLNKRLPATTSLPKVRHQNR